MSNPNEECQLCQHAGGELVVSTNLYRIVWADEPLYPGYLRLVWNEHIREFSHLSDQDQETCFKVITKLDQFLLQHMGADKVNIASLGNLVPHLHWHVVPRFKQDSHFPLSVWNELPKNAALCDQQLSIIEKKIFLIDRLRNSFKSS